MAEHSFQEVMKQWGRLCTSHCVENNDDCDGCVLGGTRADLCAAYARDTAEGSEDIEFIVMQWAEEHPEPVYPTWYDYLYSVTRKGKKDEWPINDHDFCKWLDKTPIPADIAQKLGIEPKEG